MAHLIQGDNYVDTAQYSARSLFVRQPSLRYPKKRWYNRHMPTCRVGKCCYCAIVSRFQLHIALVIVHRLLRTPFLRAAGNVSAGNLLTPRLPLLAKGQVFRQEALPVIATAAIYKYKHLSCYMVW